MSTATITERSVETNEASDQLTEALEEKLSHPATSPDFDLHTETNAVLEDIGLTTADAGGKLTFYGSDPILPSPMRFGTMAAIGLAARSVALAALWRQATGEGQDISVDVRKALRRFAGFFEGKWETINGRPPSPGGYAVSPFLKMWGCFLSRDTRWTTRGGSGHLSRAPRAHPRFSRLQSNYRIHQQCHTKVGRRGTGRGSGGRRTGSGDGAHERGISSRTPIHRGPLENAADHSGEDWRERARSAQGELAIFLSQVSAHWEWVT